MVFCFLSSGLSAHCHEPSSLCVRRQFCACPLGRIDLVGVPKRQKGLKIKELSHTVRPEPNVRQQSIQAD